MRKQKKRHFTLVEILIVIWIIALLAGIAVPSYTQYMKSARITKAQAQITVFVQAINSFNMDMKRIPDASVGLQELIENTGNSPKWKGPYLEVFEIPKDPWDNDYIYTVENGRFLITSYGADGQPGGEDENADITSRGIKKQ